MFDTLFSGLIHGSVYALAAVGMSLIFGVTNVANFAQGSLVAVGMMTAWWLGSVLGWGLLPTLLVVIVVTAALGFIMNLAVITPLEGRKPIAALLATIGVGQVIDNSLQLIFGTQTRQFPEILPTHNLQVGGLRFGTSDIAAIIMTVIAMAALWAFLKFGKTGQAIRATSQDPEAARQMGIPVASIRHISFVIGAVLAGIAGIFVGLSNGNINPTNGSSIGMTAFVAATIGGLGSIPGAVVGGVVLGVIEALGISWLGDGAHDLITFGALLLILILRPQGLLFKSAAVKSEPMTGTFLENSRSIQLPRWANWLLVVLAVALPFVSSDGLAGAGTQVAIYAIAAVGLTLISGSAGQTILGMAGPFATWSIHIRDSCNALWVVFLGRPSSRRICGCTDRQYSHIPGVETFWPLRSYCNYWCGRCYGCHYSPMGASNQWFVGNSRHTIPKSFWGNSGYAAEILPSRYCDSPCRGMGGFSITRLACGSCVFRGWSRSRCCGSLGYSLECL